MELDSLGERYAAAIEAELRSLFQDRELPFYHLMGYHLGWRDAQGQPASFPGGKRLRPTLCLLACQVVGGEWRRALPAAAAIELIHNFSLIHDDIEDQSPQRRHRPALWTVAGTAQAINLGDGMHVLAHLALWRLAERGVPPETIMRLAQLLDETCLRICEGQHLDMSFETRLDVTLDDYLAMVLRKTAALFEASLVAGALLGGADHAQLQGFGRLGVNLGLAFQMRDDILGIWGQEALLGKSTVEDIISKKKSLPVVVAFAGASAQQKHWLESIYASRRIGEADARSVVQLLDTLGSKEKGTAFVERYIAEARLATDTLPIEGKWKDIFRRLLDDLVQREE